MSRKGVSMLLILLLVSGILIFLACDTSSQIDMPLKEMQTIDDDNGIDDDDNDDTEAPATPKADEPLSPTSLDYQSIRGTAEPLSTIHVIGGLAEARTTTTEDGAFCVKVALNINAVNNLKIRAEDPAGNLSAAATINIEQRTINHSLAGEPSASSVSHSKPGNTPAKGLDGSYFSWWENTTQPWFDEALYDPQWYAVKLKRKFYLTEIAVYWGQDIVNVFEYATKYEVYINNNEDIEVMPHEVPAEDLADYGYELVEQVQQADDQNIENNIFDLSDDPVQARWIFLVLHESNQLGILPGPDGQTLYSYEVAELETFGYEEPDDGCE
ncbi:MAG: discoidin domain-containing protein [Myxococcales bacterium]|nr:discoidin domain-containing protein [Myxococcales bacterium]